MRNGQAINPTKAVTHILDARFPASDRETAFYSQNEPDEHLAAPMSRANQPISFDLRPVYRWDVKLAAEVLSRL